MQSIGPAATLHQAACKVVNDNDLAFLHYVMVIVLVKRVGLQRLLDAVKEVHIRRIVQIRNAEQLFSLCHALLGQNG